MSGAGPNAEGGETLHSEPLLGLATTRHLLEELQARGEMWPHHSDKTNAVALGSLLGARMNEMLAKLPRDMLDYRTAGSS